MAKSLQQDAYVPSIPETETAIPAPAPDAPAPLPALVRPELPEDFDTLSPRKQDMAMRVYRAALSKYSKDLAERAKASEPDRRDNSNTGIVRITELLLANAKLAGNEDTALALIRQHDVRSSTGERGPVEPGSVNAVRRDLRRYIPQLVDAGLVTADDGKTWTDAYDSAPRKVTPSRR